jgi:protein-disulfide isomerase
MDDMIELMKDDPKLKVVLKEFPVLGPASVEAARVAVAVRMQDTTGKKYLQFHQKLLSGRGQADKARALAVAKEVGLDPARLERDMASDEARASLDESFKLAEKLGLNGTPSYVIGKNVVVGAVGLAALRKGQHRPLQQPPLDIFRRVRRFAVENATVLSLGGFRFRRSGNRSNARRGG